MRFGASNSSFLLASYLPTTTFYLAASCLSTPNFLPASYVFCNLYLQFLHFDDGVNKKQWWRHHSLFVDSDQKGPQGRASLDSVLLKVKKCTRKFFFNLRSLSALNSWFICLFILLFSTDFSTCFVCFVHFACVPTTFFFHFYHFSLQKNNNNYSYF